MKSKIGGQAVIEGVMMRGESACALAVRDEKKRIRIKTWRINTEKTKKIKKIPIVRGIYSFVTSLGEGMKTLMDSADVYGEGEPSKFELWLAKKFKIDLMKVVMGFAVILACALAVGLFVLAPSYLSKWICELFSWSVSVRAIIEGVARLIIFVLYIVLTSLEKDVKRVYMYHGAEHKTINCFEKEADLTVENVKTCPRFHNRCGTSFLFFVIILTIIVFAFLNFESELVRILTRIALLPLIAGVAYELLMVIAASDSKWLFPFRLPGMLMQKITTKEPTNDMIEVALASFNAVLEMDKDRTVQPYDYFSYKYYKDVHQEIKNLFAKEKVEYDADIEWIIAKVTNKTRSSFTDYMEISKEEHEKIMTFAKERANGIPLSQVFGSVSFLGYEIEVNDKVLTPRFETEELCEKVIKDEGQNVLDLCTGSGAIAIALAKSGKTVVASGISKDAIEVCKKNAEKHGVNIEIIESNLFDCIADRRFDVIVSNPPYVKTEDIAKLQKEVKYHEPKIALDGGKDGLDFYRIIARKSVIHLVDGGRLYLEVGEGQATEVAKLLEKNFNVEIFKDMEGVKRIVKGTKNV